MQLTRETPNPSISLQRPWSQAVSKVKYPRSDLQIALLDWFGNRIDLNLYPIKVHEKDTMSLIDADCCTKVMP